jgi:hypothetical protein
LGTSGSTQRTVGDVHVFLPVLAAKSSTSVAPAADAWVASIALSSCCFARRYGTSA